MSANVLVQDVSLLTQEIQLLFNEGLSDMFYRY